MARSQRVGNANRPAPPLASLMVQRAGSDRLASNWDCACCHSGGFNQNEVIGLLLVDNGVVVGRIFFPGCSRAVHNGAAPRTAREQRARLRYD
jgi:hypothetical protein